MDKRVLSLALASFATGTETHVYAGHLAALAEALDVPIARAGQLAAAFAVTYALAAPPIAGAVAALDRRRLILAGLVALGALNLAAMAAPSFGALLAVRVLCGLAACLVGPISAAAAAALAPPEHRGRAMAAVLAGLTLSFVFGIPLGSVAGEWFGWRATFGFSGVLALVAAAAIAAVLPPVPGGERAGPRALLVAFDPAVRGRLLLTLLGFVASFSVVAYIGPVVTRVSGLTGSGVGAVQAMIGAGSIVGVLVGGRFADRPGTGRMLAASFAVSAAALGAYAALMLPPGPDPAARTALLALVTAASAAALFSRTPVIQARLVAAAPDARAVVLALNGSMIFLGQGVGAAVGGAAIAASGLEATGLVGAAVALLGAALALRGPGRAGSTSPAGAAPGAPLASHPRAGRGPGP